MRQIPIVTFVCGFISYRWATATKNENDSSFRPAFVASATMFASMVAFHLQDPLGNLILAASPAVLKNKPAVFGVISDNWRRIRLSPVNLAELSRRKRTTVRYRTLRQLKSLIRYLLKHSKNNSRVFWWGCIVLMSSFSANLWPYFWFVIQEMLLDNEIPHNFFKLIEEIMRYLGETRN